MLEKNEESAVRRVPMFSGEIRRSRSKLPLIIGICVLLLVGAILLLVPMPRTLMSSFELLPVSTIEVTAPRDGTVAEIIASNGANVTKGALVAKLDVSDAEKAVAEWEKQLETLERQKASSGKAKAKLKRDVMKAEATLKSANAAADKAMKLPKAKRAAAVSKAEKKQKAATLGLEKARAALGPSTQELERRIASAKDALAAANQKKTTSEVVASAAGVLAALSIEKGDQVLAGAKVAVVEDTSKLRAQVKVPEAEVVRKGQAVELVLPSEKKRVLFAEDGQEGKAEAVLENAKGEFSVGTRGDANIEGTPRPLVAF